MFFIINDVAKIIKKEIAFKKMTLKILAKNFVKKRKMFFKKYEDFVKNEFENAEKLSNNVMKIK